LAEARRVGEAAALNELDTKAEPEIALADQPAAAHVEPAQPNPCVPWSGPPDARHILAAGLFSILIAATYGTIAWGMFTGSVDFRAHVDIARRSYEIGRPLAPHFLFHLLTVALFVTHLASSLVLAGRLVMVGCYLVIPLLLYGLLWIVFRETILGRPLILFLAGVATFLAQPITLAHAYALGYFWPEPYQIPTSTMLKPFALAGFGCTVWFLSRRCRPDLYLTPLFALATLAGSLSKPSFLICVAPATALLAAVRFVRRLPISATALALGLYIPAAAVLGWQFYVTYSGQNVPGAYHDSIDWAPFKFMNYWTTGLFSKFLLTIAFPLAVTILYWRTAVRDTMLQLSWLSFLFGSFYSYMLAERINWSAGNMTWSGGITAFTLFVGSVVFWLRQVSVEASSGGLQRRAIFCGAILALHAISGARLDWLYLAHYGCPLDFRAVEFVCSTG